MSVLGVPGQQVEEDLLTLARKLGARGLLEGVALLPGNKARETLAVGVAFSAIYWLTALFLVSEVGALGLPVAYALATTSNVGYLILYKASIGDLRFPAAFDLLVFSLGSLAAAIWITQGGDALATLLIGAAMVAWLLVARPA